MRAYSGPPINHGTASISSGCVHATAEGSVLLSGMHATAGAPLLLLMAGKFATVGHCFYQCRYSAMFFVRFFGGESKDIDFTSVQFKLAFDRACILLPMVCHIENHTTMSSLGMLSTTQTPRGCRHTASTSAMRLPVCVAVAVPHGGGCLAK